MISNPVGPAVRVSQFSATSLTISATASVASEKYGPRRRKQMSPIGKATTAPAKRRRGSGRATGPAELEVQQHRRVCTDAKEGRVTEAHLSGEAAEEVQAAPSTRQNSTMMSRC